MAIRKDGSSFNASSNLRTALRNAGYNDATLPQPGRVFFDGVNTEVVLCHDQPGDSDALRTTKYSGRNAGNQLVDFDFADYSDDTMIRIWTIRELDFFMSSIPGISIPLRTLDGSTWTATIILNGVTYTGTDTKEVDAYCKAATNAMNGQQQFFLSMRQQ